MPTDPAPVLPASQRLQGLKNLPTALNSTQLARLDPITRRLSFFSATVEDAHLLQGLREMVQSSIDEGLPEASAVERMRQWIRETRNAATGQPYLGDRSDWTVEERVAYENSVKHIDSLARLRLIFRTQAEMGAGYAQWQKGYTRLDLAAYPAWRFYRRPGAKTFRADHEEHEGQVRLKTDLPYWLARNRVEIGGFANPWPPFGYNSWMWIAPVSRRECEKLGLLKPGEGIKPLTDEQADTWGVPRLLQTTLGDRSGRTLDDSARQHVIDTCAKHGFSIRYNEQTGKFEFGGAPASPQNVEVFEPAATLKEAKAFTRNMAKNVRFTGEIELEHVNEFNKSVYELTQEFNTPYLDKLGSYKKNSYEGAQANLFSLEINADHQTKGIHAFRESMWKEYSDKTQTRTKYRRHNVGANSNGMTIKKVIDHEFGHVLSSQCMYDEIKKGIPVGRFEYFENTPTWQLIEQCRKTAIKNGDIFKISEYAAQDGHEFFSECFAAHRQGENLSNYILDMIEFVVKQYRK